MTATWCSPCPPGSARFRAAANWRCCKSARWRRTPARAIARGVHAATPWPGSQVATWQTLGG
ncbi:hypothetical protein M5585_04265 [Serratia ureilytica]